MLLIMLSFIAAVVSAAKYSLHGVTVKALYISTGFLILASFFIGLLVIGKPINISNFFIAFGLGTCLSTIYLVSGIIFLRLGEKLIDKFLK